MFNYCRQMVETCMANQATEAGEQRFIRPESCPESCHNEDKPGLKTLSS
jgi:hypothetical protein